MPDFSSFETILTSYNIEVKFLPYILIGAAILFLLLVYIIFAYIRAFLSWITGNNEVIELQKENNALLEKLVILQNEQINILESFVSDEENTETHEIFWEDKENQEENQENAENNSEKENDTKEIEEKSSKNIHKHHKKSHH